MSRNRVAFITLFIFALCLRLVLCFLNREANDNHAQVVEWIIDKQSLPNKEDCWECFQPKLYYLINAAIVVAFHIKGHYNIVLAMQMLNFVFSFFILLFLWKFINRQTISFGIKLIAFALVAFNPCLTGINAQATNDTLIILAGILTIYYADRFFKEKKFSLAIPLTLWVILASLVKGSGIVLFAALSLIFFVRILQTIATERILYIKAFAVLVLGNLTIVPVGAGYISNYEQYKTPFVLVFEKDPPPAFAERSYVQRPGITSIVDGYFTFRYFDMIRQPYISSTIDNYPLHRTSLWSQLYGRTMFMHFDQHPRSWQSTSNEIVFTGRLLIILGLVPLLLLIRGMVVSMKDLFTKKEELILNWIHLVFVFGFLLFMVKYSYSYRDYSIMKSIFIFPALPSFIKFFMHGFDSIKSKAILKLIWISILTIILLSIYDICFLIDQLSF